MSEPSILYLYTEDLSEENRKALSDMYVHHGWPPLESEEMVATIYVWNNPEMEGEKE